MWRYGGELKQPFGFSTKRSDFASGLVYFGYRFYVPKMERWLTSDPLDVRGGLNTYGYVYQNPINHIDPDGRLAVVVVAPALAELAGWLTAGGLAGYVGWQASEAWGQHKDEDVNPPSDNPNDEGEDCPVDDTHPSTPTGQRGGPLDVKPGSNSPTNINGRDYTGHALDRMQGRGVPPSAVEDAIQNGQPSSGNSSSTTVHVGQNGVTVVTGTNGQVIIVITK